MSAHACGRRANVARAPAALCAAALLALVPSAAADTPATPPVPDAALASVPASQQGTPVVSKPLASATLEQCATANAPQTERSATFAGEMTAIPGTAHMALRIDLEELGPGETRYRIVSAPSLGTWQRSNPGVKNFTHIQQVTNLSAPAFYRADIRFRWVTARGRMLKTEELHTASCEQPAASSTGGANLGTPTASASG
jgi:hypothetical protein